MTHIEIVIVSNQGKIDEIQSFRQHRNALDFFVKSAESFGVVFDEDRVKRACYDDMSVDSIMRDAKKQLEGTGTEIQWFNPPLT